MGSSCSVSTVSDWTTSSLSCGAVSSYSSWSWKVETARIDVSQVRWAIMQWEKEWKAMMPELGGDAQGYRLSLTFPKDVKE